MLEHLYSAESWRSIEFWSRLAAVILAGIAAVLGGVTFLASQNAKLRDAEPRTVGPATPPTSAVLPLSVLIVAHSSDEAQSYADQLASAMPTGSRISRLVIGSVIGTKREPLLYSRNGNDPDPLLAWLRSRGLEASEVSDPPVPYSLLTRVKDSVVLVVGPKRRPEP